MNLYNKTFEFGIDGMDGKILCDKNALTKKVSFQSIHWKQILILVMH